MQLDSTNEGQVSPAEIGSHIRRLRRMLTHNQNLIALFDAYWHAATQIKKELAGLGEIPGLQANCITAVGLSISVINALRDDNVQIEQQIADLTGQLALWKE